MADVLGAPRCYANVYPHEGGVYAIQGAQIIACNIRKHFEEPAGEFQLTLAPGGPNGPNVGPSWLDIITPMSFVMIGMTRGSYKQIVMLGVVTHMSEEWNFEANPPTRNVIVRGQDFGYFFSHFSWYALTVVNLAALVTAASIGAGAGAAALGTEAGLGGYLTQGTPDEIGKAWYLSVMDGPRGILYKTYVLSANNPVLFQNAVTALFERYVSDIKVLWSFSYVNTEESWYNKFKKIFPFPWYEFFITTAPVGFYNNALTTSWNIANEASTTFTMPQLGDSAGAQVYAIARVNPLPTLTASNNGSGIVFGAMDHKAWDALPSFPEDTNFIGTYEEFNEQEVRNFYVVNPTFKMNQLGQANDMVTPALLLGGGAADPASIHRYGFRPVYMETDWFADQEGYIAQQQAQQSQTLQFQQALAQLVARLASQYEPTPLMMKAVRRGVLRPDIVPGCKFTYQPLKDKISAPWTFYIDGVEHNYRFGGPSTTTLYLSRGLPSDVYSATNSGAILQNIHMGNAQRVNGAYQVGLPSPTSEPETGLEGISLLPGQMQKVLGQISPIYNLPQGDSSADDKPP